MTPLAKELLQQLLEFSTSRDRALIARYTRDEIRQAVDKALANGCMPNLISSQENVSLKNTTRKKLLIPNADKIEEISLSTH